MLQCNKGDRMYYLSSQARGFYVCYGKEKSEQYSTVKVIFKLISCNAGEAEYILFGAYT